MLGTFRIFSFGIGICLGFRAWNLVFEAELCSGGVHPRLSGGCKTRPYGIGLRQRPAYRRSGGVHPRLTSGDDQGRCKGISQSTIIIAYNPGDKC